VQIFTKNNNQWRARPISDADVECFQSTLENSTVAYPLAHSSYLINLASPNRTLWKTSVDAFVVELQRADRLRIPFVVLHPGAFTSSSERAGLKRVVRALNEVHRQTRGLGAQCLVETTAGQGTALGWRFEHLAGIVQGVAAPEKIGICFDTCHVFAAGYGLTSPKEYQATMRTFNRLVGIKLIKALHLNDSRRGLGSRVDRHDHIGRGQLGLGAFANLLKDRRFANIPMYLETPKGQENGVELDVINLTTLRSLCR
jgi:deoxyribonuclease-4